MNEEAGENAAPASVEGERGVRDLYGIELGDVTAGGAKFGATVPVPGTGNIVAVHLMAGRLDAAPLPGTVSWWMFWNDIVPTSLTELQAGEAVFGLLRGPTNPAGIVTVSSDAGVLTLRGPFEAEPRGRMFTVRCYVNGPKSLAAAAYLVFERCAASPEAASRGLGSCWG